MKQLLLIFAFVAAASCCPYSFFTGMRPAAEPNVDKLCAPILEKEAPGLSLKGELKVEGDWAFFFGDVVNDAGKHVTPPDGISSDSVVLFRKLDGKWMVVEHGIGISDMYWTVWIDEYGVPKELVMP